ncbi:MAG: DUF2237 domain-containing protein [Pseudomonadota bacterium]
MEKYESVNVFGDKLEPCSSAPLTGFFRDGCCNTGVLDAGSHTVCAELTQEFLEFSRARGNDLMSPQPHYGFPGLKSGQCWCLCAGRWLEAHREGAAPRVYLRRTHIKVLESVPLDVLRSYALDLQ